VTRLLPILLLSALFGTTGPAVDLNRDAVTRPAEARFAWVDVSIDPRGKPLACYQFELTARDADVTLVGVEGGEHAAFIQPPYYDPHANVQNRIVIAAFNTGADLPRTRTRVARVMVRVSGPRQPKYAATLQVAADSAANKIQAAISTSEGAAP